MHAHAHAHAHAYMPPNHHHDALLWMAPLLSGGGYSSESLGFALGLHNLTRLDGGLMAGVRQFGEPQDESFVEGLPKALIPPLRHLFGAGASQDAASGVVVCHSTPDAWVPSKFEGWDELEPCPPPTAAVSVGRTMFETDSVPREWVERCR